MKRIHSRSLGGEVSLEIDPNKIPERVAVDTSVLIATKKPTDINHELCKAFWNAALAKGVTIIIPAVSYAEFSRSRPEHIPRLQGVEVAAFDLRAAEIAQEIPQSALKKNGDRQIAKVDGLIAATAKRHLATHLFTLDPQQATVAKALGLNVISGADDLTAAQAKLL